MTSVAAGMAGQAVTTGMGSYNLHDGNAHSLSSHAFKTDSVQSLNNLVGGLVSSGVTYAMTGNAKYNVLNASMFGSCGKNGVLRTGGMLELNFGDDGFSAGFGMGGTDISVGTLYSAKQGYDESKRILAKKYGTKEDLLALNVANGLGSTRNENDWSLGRAVFEGREKLNFSELETGLGTVHNGQAMLDNRLLSGTDAESSAQIAMLYAHEQDHIAGGDETSAYLRQISGFADLMGAWGVTGEGMISGTGAAATYYQANGKDATVSYLSDLGVLNPSDGQQYNQMLLDPMTKQMIDNRYASLVGDKDIQKIYNSENIREKYVENLKGGKGFMPIKAKEMNSFLTGEDVRLGVEAATRLKALNGYKAMIDLSDALYNAGNDQQVAAREEAFKALGIDISKCKGLSSSMYQSMNATVMKFMPIYTEFALGQGAGKVADSLGVHLSPGSLSVLTKATNDAAYGKTSTSSEMLQEYAISALQDTLESVAKDKLKGKDVSVFIDLMRANFEAIGAGYELAQDSRRIGDSYSDGLTKMQNAERMWSYTKECMTTSLAEEYGQYSSAQAFIKGLSEPYAISNWSATDGGNSYYNSIIRDEASSMGAPDNLINSIITYMDIQLTRILAIVTNTLKASRLFCYQLRIVISLNALNRLAILNLKMEQITRQDCII